jgi:hypothetical protein
VWKIRGSVQRPVAGRGVVDDAVGSPRVFGRAYLDDLVAHVSMAVDYFLLDDDDDTAWRILVWDVPATGYDQRSTVPRPVTAPACSTRSLWPSKAASPTT